MAVVAWAGDGSVAVFWLAARDVFDLKGSEEMVELNADCFWLFLSLLILP